VSLTNRRPVPPKPARAFGGGGTRRRRILIALIVTCVAAPAAGWTYDQYATRRDARRFPPPGAFVDAGSRRLHYVCAGSGSPLVLFELSGFSNSMSFRDAREALSRRTRVCAYDRTGIGWSDPGPSAIPVSRLADDLGTVLNVLEPKRTAILVASSIGGVTAEFFARRHPERVAGLVFLDAGNSYAAIRIREHTRAALASVACGSARAAGALGLLRLFDPWNLRDQQTEQAARSAALMYGSKPWNMLCGMVRAGDATLREFREAPPLPRSLPVTALSAETREALLPPAMASWFDMGNSAAALRATHQRLAQGSDHGVWKVVPGSNHLIASSQPQAVVDAVNEMISASALRTAAFGGYDRSQ
jgi:pimeloyl-ACP methyl ester carboxylesterase